MDEQRQMAAGNISPPIQEQIVTTDHIHFFHYPDPEQWFGTEPRPLRIIESRPPTVGYTNAIYTPTATKRWVSFGCLYDSDLNRIDDSCEWVGRDDQCLSEEPLTFAGNPKDLPVYEPPTVYLGYIHPHFGHFLMQTIARWWILGEEIPPETRFLVHIDNPSILNSTLTRDGLAFAGIDPERLVFFDRPTIIRNVLVPRPAVQLQSHAYTRYRDFLHDRVAEMGLPAGNETDQPLYISRRLLKSGVTKFMGEEKVEAFLLDKGVRIIHPQKLPLAEQIRLFNKHRRIIGLHGSGMQTIVFSRTAKTITYLGRYWIQNTSCIFNKLFESDATYVQSCQWPGRLRSLRYKTMVKWGDFLQIRLLHHEMLFTWFKNHGDL